MRPIKLKMTAFGAYVKPVELDFVTGLGDENFFLIHGATGSGKTTILDAICFALYGESSGGGRKGSMMRSEQATPADKTEVEFTFALRGKTYRIKRSPKYLRASKRGGGLTEEKASAEIFADGKPIETRDVSEYVRELLHFDSDQFRQVVVLPQGAFQKFLLAKSDVRQAVLNTLFNAEFFKRVEDELKLKAADARKIFDDLTSRKKNFLEEAACTEIELPALIKQLAEELDAAQS
ncbi:MAG: SMC family ATPase [Selenomonadaceae bacterium]|nr:SMC family ATPase [Selenomonadaceae bacterium]